MPGSQKMNSIGLAYFLYTYRWIFRIILGGLLLISAWQSLKSKRKVLKILGLLIYAAIIYLFNFKMTAEAMFLQPKKLQMADKSANKVELQRMVMGVFVNGKASAYPIQFLGYHHQVRDSIGGEPVMVTYCTVCRTGRVYKPLVDSKTVSFRLVGMDHFNAMFEDEESKSWWRQSTGECIAGKHKGQFLPEIPFVQVSLEEWLNTHPDSKVMQPSPEFSGIYEKMSNYESGKSRNPLTGTDTGSWKDKSWVLGITLNGKSKAYDWNELKSKGIINDKIGGLPVLLVLSADQKSFYAFRTDNPKDLFEKEGNTLKAINTNRQYNFSGEPLTKDYSGLTPIPVYQEFWHSWKTFHPGTEKH